MLMELDDLRWYQNLSRELLVVGWGHTHPKVGYGSDKPVPRERCRTHNSHFTSKVILDLAILDSIWRVFLDDLVEL